MIMPTSNIMLSRPLDLASKLTPPPRNFDLFFYINVGALALFFVIFGSRFVLAPGLVVSLPDLASSRAQATRTTSHLKILGSGQILTDGGMKTLAELPGWLKSEALLAKKPVLLILAGVDVPVESVTRVYGMAAEAHFSEIVLGTQQTTGANNP